MVSVFHYLDYREYLREWFEAKKAENTWYSYKVFGEGVGLDPSQVFRIMQKQLHISKAALPRFRAYLSLQGAAGHYFDRLVALGRARKEAEARELFSELLAMRGSRARILVPDQFRLYEEWYHPVVRALINVMDITNNYEILACALTPPITAFQAKKSLELLRRMHLAERDGSGIWRATEKSVSTGSGFRSLLVRQYQAKSLDMARESLERHSVEQRDIHVINMAVDASAFRDCLHILEEARSQLRQRVEKVREPDRILRLAHAFFPVAQIPEVK